MFGRDGVGGQLFYLRCYVGYGSYLVGIDVGGMGAAQDTTEMDRLLPGAARPQRGELMGSESVLVR